jgi:hypothetical protein
MLPLVTMRELLVPESEPRKNEMEELPKSFARPVLPITDFLDSTQNIYRQSEPPPESRATCSRAHSL